MQDENAEPTLDQMLDDVTRSGLATEEALKAKADKDPEHEEPDGDEPCEECGNEPCACEAAPAAEGAPAAAASTEGGAAPAPEEESLKGAELVGVPADEFIAEIEGLVERRVGALLAPALETLKSLTDAAKLTLGLAKNAVELGKANAETMKSINAAIALQGETLKAIGATNEALKALTTTPAAVPARPGAAVSRNLPTPRRLADPNADGGPLSKAEVNKALNLNLISAARAAQLDDCISTSTVPADFDLNAFRAQLGQAIKS